MAPMPRTPQTAEQLKNTAELLIERANDLQIEVGRIKLHELPEIHVRNYDQCRRALEYLGNFVNAVRDAIYEERAQRGFYGGEPVSDTPALKPKKPGTKQHRSGHTTKSTDTKNKP